MFQEELERGYNERQDRSGRSPGGKLNWPFHLQVIVLQILQLQRWNLQIETYTQISQAYQLL